MSENGSHFGSYRFTKKSNGAAGVYEISVLKTRSDVYWFNTLQMDPSRSSY